MGALRQERTGGQSVSQWSLLLCSDLRLTLLHVSPGWPAGLLSGVCCGGQDSLHRITDQEQCLLSQIRPDNGVGFHVNISVLQAPCKHSIPSTTAV